MRYIFELKNALHFYKGWALHQLYNKTSSSVDAANKIGRN